MNKLSSIIEGGFALIHSKPGDGPSSRGRVAPQERSSQPSCMFVEVSNSSYAATRNPLGNRKSPSGNSAAKASWRNTELNRGCEVKRVTLNLVVSPVIEKIRAGQSRCEGRRQKRQGRYGRVLAYRPGVADSIEQHIMNRDKPGGQTILGAGLRQRRVCRYNHERECGKRESG